MIKDAHARGLSYFFYRTVSPSSAGCSFMSYMTLFFFSVVKESVLHYPITSVLRAFQKPIHQDLREGGERGREREREGERGRERGG